MAKAGRIVIAVAFVGACGRFGFGPSGTGGDAAMDGNTSDGPVLLTCPGLDSTCGPDGTEPCCGNSLVPGGTYYRSFDVAGDGWYEDMTAPATVRDFRLDTYEVTVGRFRRFVEAGLGTQQNPPPTGAGGRSLNGAIDQGGWDASWTASLALDTAAFLVDVKCDMFRHSWTDSPGANEALPMNCITWYEAFAFCAWDGGFLPTEAEWNYAAVGGDEHRAYPWSIPASSLDIDCTRANYCAAPPPAESVILRVGRSSPRGDGKYGHSDLAGNVSEWTLDGFQEPYATPCDNCANLTATTFRVSRGGSYNTHPLFLRGASRGTGFGRTPSLRSFMQGVRCARSVVPAS